MDPRARFLIPVIMTFFMSFTMSGFMSLVEMGPSLAWLMAWPRHFLIAWPVAFGLTLLFMPMVMGLTRRILARF